MSCAAGGFRRTLVVLHPSNTPPRFAPGLLFPSYFFAFFFLGRPPSLPSSRILFRPYFPKVARPPRRPASATVIAFFLMVAEYKSERPLWQEVFAFYSLVPGLTAGPPSLILSANGAVKEGEFPVD